jgi:ABC-type nitrate/sulfonate/bicarbonate transport system ATPase subunit
MEQVPQMKKIQVISLTKSFIERRSRHSSFIPCIKNSRCLVLDNLNFEIEDGMFTCFVGPSGCGKSTLLRIMAGFDTPSSGKVVIDGQQVQGPGKKHIFVFQEDGLFPWMTVMENAAIGVDRKLNRQEQEDEIREYIDMVGLEGFENHYPHELSGGMRRRAEVARALITNPDILFMDEPFAALDFVTRLQMREEMLNVHAMFDSTILFITHDIEEALQLGDQVIVLGERPASVKADIPLPFSHPRDVMQGKLSDIRKEIYFLMGLHNAL